MSDVESKRSRSPLRKKGESGGRRAPPERRVFISNIPFDMKWQEVKDMFRKEVGDVTYVELFTDEDDKPRGCGILELASADLAKKAIDEMHRSELRGRKLVVKEDFDTERDQYGRIISGGGSRKRSRSPRSRSSANRSSSSRRDHHRERGSSSRLMNPQDFGNTYGLSAHFLDSLGVSGPLQNRVFVANLSYTVDEPKLKEVFRLAGKVVSVDLNRDKNGKSRGFGVVEYNHPVEAVQAISMFNEQLLFDRRMTVRFDNQAPEEKDDVLPSRLPEGLGGVGMGLGSGGNPLTDVTRNLPSLSSNNESGNSNMAAANTMNLDFMSNVAKLVNTMEFLSNNPGNNMGGGGNNMGVGNPSSNNMGGNMGGGNMGGNMGGSNMGGNMGGGNNNMGMNMGSGNNMNEPRNIGGYSSGNGGFPSNNGDGVRMGGGMMNDGRVDMGGAQSGVQSRNSDSIIIRNLPVDCNWQALRDGFSHCGDIKYAEMKDRTIGLIRFTSERDAERAVSMMDKHVIGNRTIDVNLY